MAYITRNGEFKNKHFMHFQCSTSLASKIN